MNKKEFMEFVYGLKPYIEKLRLEGKEEKLVQTFQKHYPELTISYSYKNTAVSELRFRRQNHEGISWRIYKLTDYDCTLTNDFANLDYRSETICTDTIVKDIYIKFMSETFSDYKTNLYKNQSSNLELTK